MPDIQIVKMDQGGANARILAKEATKADFRRVEAASLKMPSASRAPRAKRYFVRLFNTLQLNPLHLGDRPDAARSRGREQVETAIRTQMETVAENLNKAIDGAGRCSR